MRYGMFGKKHTEKAKKKIGKAKIGNKNPAWKGGIYLNGTSQRKWRKQERKRNPKFRLDENMRSLVWISLRGKKSGRTWRKLVGYTIENLMKHLEKQFDDKMTWENYGSYWWIDHIKPRSLFKYENVENPEFKKCWALENLQPMEKIANIKKGNHFI